MSLYELSMSGEPGTSPGSIIPDSDSPPPEVTAFGFGSGGLEEYDAVPFSSLEAIIERHDMVWLDIQGLGDVAFLRDLGALCGIHSLVLEDAVNIGQRAKLEEYEDDAIFLVLWMLSLEEHAVQREQLGIFARPGLVVTFQERPGDCLDPVRDRLRRGRKRLLAGGADYLTYALIDAVVDHYIPVLETLSDQVEEIEDRIVEDQSTEEASEIHRVKRALLSVRRATWPLREALHKAAHADIALIADETRPYMRDCHDHVLRVIDVTESYRELATGLMDLHLSTISNRMNEVMKVLTIIATLFIPMTFISSIYGMNFDSGSSPFNMPELGWRYGYPIALLAMLIFATTLLLWFRRKGWIGSRATRSRSTSS